MFIFQRVDFCLRLAAQDFLHKLFWKIAIGTKKNNPIKAKLFVL